MTPLNLIAAEVTASSVQLSWQTPESDMNHVIKEYQVLYRAQGNTQQIAMTRWVVFLLDEYISNSLTQRKLSHSTKRLNYRVTMMTDRY